MKKKILAGLAALMVVVLGGLIFHGDVGAASLVTRVELLVVGNHSNVLDHGTVAVPLRLQKSLDLASGSGLSQANMIFADTRTLTASSNEDLDVVGGALTDAFGATFTLARVKLLAVCAASGNTNSVVILGDANTVPILSTAATTHTVAPNGCAVFVNPTAAGWAVTAGTGDIIQIANSGAGTSVTYDIVIIGASS